MSLIKAIQNLSGAGMSHPVRHWWHQRLTAVALVPLSIWLLVFFNYAQHAAYAETLAWLATPVNLVAVALWAVMAFTHAALGLQVVLEDYVSDLCIRQLAIKAVYLVFFALLALALLALAVIFLRA